MTTTPVPLCSGCTPAPAPVPCGRCGGTGSYVAGLKCSRCFGTGHVPPQPRNESGIPAPIVPEKAGRHAFPLLAMFALALSACGEVTYAPDAPPVAGEARTEAAAPADLVTDPPPPPPAADAAPATCDPAGIYGNNCVAGRNAPQLKDGAPCVLCLRAGSSAPVGGCYWELAASWCVLDCGECAAADGGTP